MFLLWLLLVENRMNVSLALFPDMILCALVTIPVTATITGATKRFTFHIS